MREIRFQFGSKEKGWKYYICNEKESVWDKERENMYGLGGNMYYWTHPVENI